MKKAIIFHGTDCKPEDFWYPWLKKELENAGYTVEVPSYPELNHEPLEDTLKKVLVNHTFDQDTIIIGHSAGGPLLLSILENIDTKLRQAILVAGYSQLRTGETKLDPIQQETYDWQKIKNNVQDIVFINSVNDPWNCDADQGRAMFDKLGGTQIIRNEGHFGSETYNQPYKEFPLLKALILGGAS